jgi:hypothetical protein
VHQQKGRKREYLRYKADLTMSYGKANRPHTPMNDIMNNIYGLEAEEKIQSRYVFRSQQVN